MLLLGALPLVVIFFYNMNYEKLVLSRAFRQRWGSLYLGLVNDKESSKTTVAYKYPALQLTRQFALGIMLVVLEKYWVL